MEYDLKIANGTIIDGTGQPGVTGDLAIKDGKIAASGKAPGKARDTIDARGKIVAPGFIDIHTHYDAQVMWDRMMTISPWRGVTTVVTGNCGFGVAPTRPEHRGLIMRTLEKVEGMSLAALEEGLGYNWPFESFGQYLDAVERRGTAINFGALVGHTPIRMYVMGEESTERPAAEAEIAQMREIVRSAMKAGALGFATSKSQTHVGYSGKPVPSRAADVAEIKALAAVLGEMGEGIIQATVGRELFLKEFVEIAQATGRPVTWTALLAGMSGMAGPDSHQKLLRESEAIFDRGIAVVPQVTCRPLNFEFTFKEPFLFESMPVFAGISAADLEGKKLIYATTDFRGAFKSKAGAESGGPFSNRWDRTTISYCPSDPSLEERVVSEVARERRCDPIDLALDLALASNLEARFRMSIFNDDEDQVAELLHGRGTVLGLSDAGAHASQLCDACFSTYLLQRWVREKKAISLERAIWMLTARPAEVFGIKDRGRLEVGLAADVTVFDPDKVGCSKLRRVNDMPGGQDRLVADASGIDAVIVNGTLIRHHGKDAVATDGPLPGRVLRHGSASQAA
ncbi:MAG: amidohydrolase family protein [Candidatus Binatus sp.]|uniref:N-acyl-D-amino-acid deacylase family protein n=1 Tax=Candidatus Binatus sp. TaxID=2811406 RepID=UPI0027270143|nr:amidohydrolase family protein [Candidatus Binatus sp.]MDO8431160.1 amidohydrolase family protein [Candidatus Binatus sp.]